LRQDWNRVAVKKLIDSAEDEFLKEATILRALAPNEHPHLLQLLATFKQTKSQEGVKWHFIFPFADENLRDYWNKTEPNPKFDQETVFWVVRQMAGIADGLSHVHIHRVKKPLSVPGAAAGGVRIKEGKTMSVKEGEEWFGRHGDMKPENMLWFSNDPKHVDARGNLRIADFGLGRFHGLDSRSKVPPQTITGTPTYEPPELNLRIPVSRAYDIWGLGCLFLEFVTWLLMGGKAVEKFSKERLEASYHSMPNMTDDSFYSIIGGENGDPIFAVVRKGVLKWVARLHQHRHCTDLIHDILNLVMKDMLVAEKEQRKSAAELYKSFLGFKTKMENNIDYALQPTPWPADETQDTPAEEVPADAQVDPLILPLRHRTTVHFERDIS
jgi:serine/threonine protein kinase